MPGLLWAWARGRMACWEPLFSSEPQLSRASALIRVRCGERKGHDRRRDRAAVVVAGSAKSVIGRRCTEDFGEAGGLEAPEQIIAALNFLFQGY